MRNLTKTLAVVSILTPAIAHPLGIGDIKLHSALNQNLNAEIALQLSGENISDIKVSLAPPEKFDEAGVAWNYFLSKIKFETIARPNGSVVIKLTSREVLKEPFLDLLLEVSWPKGNLYREFTVLVDPPSVYNQATIPVATTTPSAASESMRYSAPQSRFEGSSNGTDQYGPTRKNDTLWRVAEGLSRQQGVSVEQMMMALYQANPNAFYQNSVHALMAGKTLKVPEKEAILRLSRHQALAEFNKQTNAWKNRQTPAPVKEADVKEEAVTENQLKLTAPVEATVAENALIAPGDDQVTSEKKSSAQPVEGEKTDLGVVPAPTSAADTAIQTKIAALEKQLAVMQQLITLKDQQLAAIQNQAQQVQVKPAAQEQAVAEIPATKPTDVSQTAPEPTLKPIVDAPIASLAPQSVVEPAIATPAPQPVVAPPVPKPKAKRHVVQPPAPVVEDSSYLYYWGLGGVGVVGVLGWLWSRRRQAVDETGAESMFASSSLIKVPDEEDIFSVPVVEDSAAYTVGESSFLSEFTPSDFNSFDSDQGEIDPISEADVYLAYGRYQQAEELMRHAIKDFPERDECKLKLLEIFCASENKQAFATFANELALEGKNKHVDFWSKVAEMGEDICPELPLFSNGAAHFNNEQAVTKSSNTTSPELDADELDLELAAFQESLKNEPAPAASAKQAKDLALDYDLTSFEIEDVNFADDAPNNQDIDFDLSSFASAPDKTNDSNKAGVADSNNQGIDFDLSSFSIPSIETNANETAVDDSIDDLETFEFDFDSFGTETAPPAKPSPSVSIGEQKITPASELLLENSLSFDDDDFDFSFGSDEDDSSFSAESQDDQYTVSDLTDMDELETKLDLAKAYVDMGDMGAARDIASEVLTKGTDAQKAAAQELLNDLS